ncbi:MAG TPA: YjjG family noncanonical pyrimidine nucleotidase [Bacteroidia bacterium]|nr:YjjG family noncanonical pyrimidine nucleotidase [Bacteroidia bacterium]HNS12692.1 YjjG family noncanonical pyrimidine nucleotidase [Bacteroidia bacterium]
MKKTYRHIFFDLDNTIWDFEQNSREALIEIYHKHDLPRLGVKSVELFIDKYRERNEMMWEQYRLGTIDKTTLRDKRFALTFWDMGLDAEAAPAALADDYLSISPKKTILFPHAHEVLGYLAEKYKLHIITNGFEEAQSIKMQESKLLPYFEEVIISEHTGFRKPDNRIFEYALKKTMARAGESIMIGDGLEVDVLGALNAGMDAIYFNPEKKSHTEILTYEIKSLDELKSIL